MKIKTQLGIFLAGIITIPVLAAAIYLQNLRFSFSSKANSFKIDKYSEFMVFNNESIVDTNIPGFKAGEQYSEQEITNFITETSGHYLYQFIISDKEDDSNDGMKFIIRRTNRHNIVKIVAGYILAIVILIEITILLFTFKLTKTIFDSISILKVSTQRIADGELDEPLDKMCSPSANNEITELVDNIEKLRQKLKENNDVGKNFVMGLSHDLRSPLAVIKGYAEAINDGVVSNSNEIKKSSEIIFSKAEHLERMVNSLLEYAKARMQSKTLDKETLFLKKPIAPVIKTFFNMCESTGNIFNRKVKILMKCSDKIEIKFNEELLLRLLENLFSNAVRYTNNGDLITLSATETEDFVVIEVEDTGIGAEQKELRHFFDLFYKASNSRREEGMGIGLSVVKSIIELHKWKIAVQSQKGIGTCFTITIPKNDSEE